MKALEKDRRRRYETASDLAADVKRYLGGQPVEACPPSAWYRLSKSIRRHRASLATAVTILFLLIAGTAASAWQAIRATSAERRATSNLELGLRAVDELYEDVVGRSFNDLLWSPTLPRSFLETALPFFQRYAEARRVDPGVALATLRAGQILIQLRRFAEAEAAVKRAIVIYEALLAVDPENVQHQRDFAACSRGTVQSAYPLGGPYSGNREGDRSPRRNYQTVSRVNSLPARAGYQPQGNWELHDQWARWGRSRRTSPALASSASNSARRIPMIRICKVIWGTRYANSRRGT